MISIVTVVEVCNAFLDTVRRAPCHAITTNPDNVPFYRPKDFRPEICSEAYNNNKAVAHICRNFYKNLPLEASTAECPFGITLYFQRTKLAERTICVYQQVVYNPKNQSVVNFPRADKKAAKKALQSDTATFDARVVTSKYEFAKELLSTLLTGRVAESIRGFSHHLLTPLQGAIADVQVLEEKQSNGADVIERLRRNLEDVNASAKQIQLLLSEEAEFNPKKLRKVVVHRQIADVMVALEAEAHPRFIKLEQSYNGVAREVEAIPDHFQLLVSALLQNAVKYSFDGFENKHRVVRVSYANENENLIIRIFNEGCGIEGDEISEGRIFELGYRGRKSGDRGRSGTGTGLYLANKIIRAHGGLLRVTSTKTRTASDPAFQAYENRFEVVWPIYSPFRKD